MVVTPNPEAVGLGGAKPTPFSMPTWANGTASGDVYVVPNVYVQAGQQHAPFLPPLATARVEFPVRPAARADERGGEGGGAGGIGNVTDMAHAYGMGEPAQGGAESLNPPGTPVTPADPNQPGEQADPEPPAAGLPTQDPDQRGTGQQTPRPDPEPPAPGFHVTPNPDEPLPLPE